MMFNVYAGAQQPDARAASPGAPHRSQVPPVMSLLPRPSSPVVSQVWSSGALSRFATPSASVWMNSGYLGERHPAAHAEISSLMTPVLTSAPGSVRQQCPTVSQQQSRFSGCAVQSSASPCSPQFSDFSTESGHGPHARNAAVGGSSYVVTQGLSVYTAPVAPQQTGVREASPYHIRTGYGRGASPERVWYGAAQQPWLAGAAGAAARAPDMPTRQAAQSRPAPRDNSASHSHPRTGECFGGGSGAAELLYRQACGTSGSVAGQSSPLQSSMDGFADAERRQLPPSAGSCMTTRLFEVTNGDKSDLCEQGATASQLSGARTQTTIAEKVQVRPPVLRPQSPPTLVRHYTATPTAFDSLYASSIQLENGQNRSASGRQVAEGVGVTSNMHAPGELSPTPAGDCVTGPSYYNAQPVSSLVWRYPSARVPAVQEMPHAGPQDSLRRPNSAPPLHTRKSDHQRAEQSLQHSQRQRALSPVPLTGGLSQHPSNCVRGPQPGPATVVTAVSGSPSVSWSERPRIFSTTHSCALSDVKTRESQVLASPSVAARIKSFFLGQPKPPSASYSGYVAARTAPSPAKGKPEKVVQSSRESGNTVRVSGFGGTGEGTLGSSLQQTTFQQEDQRTHGLTRQSHLSAPAKLRGESVSRLEPQAAAQRRYHEHEGLAQYEGNSNPKKPQDASQLQQRFPSSCQHGAQRVPLETFQQQSHVQATQNPLGSGDPCLPSGGGGSAGRFYQAGQQMQAGLYQSPPSQRQPTPQASHRPEEAVGLHHRQGCSEVSDTPAPAMGSRASGPCCVLEDPGVRGAVFRPDGLPAPKMSEATSCREKSNLSPETASSRSISKSPGPSHHHRTVQSSPPAPVASPDAQLTNKGTATFKTQQKVTDQSKGLSGESEELGNSLMPESKSCSDQLHGESHAGAGSSGSTQETSAPQSLASSDSADGRGAVPIGLPQSETTVNEEGIPAAVNPLRASDRCSSTTDSCRRKISESTGDDRHTSVSSAHWRTPPRDESLSAETRFEMLKESMHRRLRNQNAQAEDLTTSPRRLLSSVAGTPRRNRNGTVSSGLGQSESGDVIPLRDFLWDPEKAFAKSSRENRMAEEEDEYVGPSSEETLQGCKIDDFELADPRFGGDASLLGRGTYGVVRKLRHKRTGKVYAVKSIEKENVVRAGMVSQVEFELLVQKDLLRHRNVLRCFACVEDSDQVHLILEYCSRGDLYTRIRSQPLRRLGEQEAFIYFSQLVNGLHYLHSRGVMHRDLKLENLLLDGKNVLKIADLGWCGSVLGKAKNFNFCGTLDYLAPEMIKGAGHDWRVDLWGAGILLYEMLDGKPPFQSTRHLELVQQVLKAKVNLGPHIAPDAGDLITKLLRYDPEERITLHTLPQHPWIRRMWLQLRDQYYSRYPHAVPRISAAVASRAPHPGAASVWPLPNACDSLDLRDYLGPPAPTPPPSLTRGPDERTAAMCGAPDAARKGGGRTKSQSEGCSLTNTPGTPVPPVRPTGMKASQVDSANTACAAFAPSQLTASQAPLSTVVGARWDEFPSAPAKKGIAVTEREEALETGEPSGHQSSQNPARQATVTLTAHGKSRDRPGGSPRLVSSGGDILGRSDSRFGGNSTVASSFEALPERSTDSDSEVGDDEGLGCPASTAGNTDGSGPGCRPALQTQNSRPNSLLEPSDSASKLREFPELNDAAVRKTGDEVHDASGRIIEVMSTQASGGKRDLASSERPGPLPFIRNKVSFPSEAVQEETVDDSSVSLPPRRRKKAVASRSIGKSSGSSSNVTQPQSSILQNVSHTGEPKGQPPGSHGEAHQASGSASHLPSKQRRSCVSASVVERSVSKATATLGQDSGLPAKKVIFSAKAPDANGGGSPRRPRSPSCGRRTPGALRKSLRGTSKSMDCTKDSSPSKPAKSSGCGPKIFTGVSRRLNPGSQIKHTVLRADTWNDDAADVGRDRNEDRYEDRLHPARISLGIDALAKAKGETEERASAKRGLQPKRFPCADPQSVRTRQSKRCQISAVTKPSSSTDQPARSTSSLQLPPNCAKPDTPWTSSSCHTDFSMGGFLQPHAPSLGVANEPQSNSVSSIVDHDHGLEGLSSLQCHVAYPFSMSFHPDDQGRLVGSQDGLPLLDPWSAGDCPARPPSQTSHESGELDCFADHLSVGSAGDDLLVPTTECSPDGRQRSDPRNPSSASSRCRSALGPRRPFGAGADSSSHVGVKGQGERKAAPSATQRRGFSADTAGKENRLGAGFNRSSSAQTREQRGAFSRLPSRGVSSVRRERSSDGSTANAPVRREGGRAAPVAQTSSAAAGSCAEAGSASQLGGFKTPVRTEAGYDPLQGVGAGEIIDVAGANPYRIATGFGASFGRNAGGCAPEPRPQLRDPSPASPMPQRRNSPAEGSSGRPGPTSVTSSRVQSPSRLPDGAAHRRPWSTPPSGIGTYYSNLNFPFSTKAVPANTVARPVGTSGTQYVPGRAASPVQWNPSTTLRQRSSANAQAGRNVMHGPLHHPDHSSDTRSVQERSAAFSGNTRRPLSSFGQGSLTASAAARANNMWLSGSPSQINPTYAAPGFAGTQQPAQASYSQMQRWQLQNQLPRHSVLQRTLHAGDVGPTQQGIRRQPWDAGQLQQPSWTTSPVDPPRCACVGSYPHSPKQVSAAWGEGTGNRAPALSQPASPGMYHHSAALAAAGARLPTSSQGGSLQCSWKPVFCSPPPVQLRSVDNARVAGVVWSPQNAAWA